MTPSLFRIMLLLYCCITATYATIWSKVSGNCSTDGQTLFSPNYPENYEYKGKCSFSALISGAELVTTSFEEYDETLKPKYTLTPLNGSEEIVCTCINDQWETTFEVNLDTNLSIGYVGGDVTTKQPPWLMELDFICRSPCQDLNAYGDACVGECENPWEDRDGLSCRVYEKRGFCANGKHLQFEAEYFDNFIGGRSANVSALGGCCSCGGGTGTPVAIAQPCVQDGVVYGCDLPSDTQCARIDLVYREPLIIAPSPAPYVYIFDLNNLPEYGWGVVGALVAIGVFGITGVSCCTENARRRRLYLEAMLDQ